MDDEALDLLLSGNSAKLPPLPKRVVRLFVSSTFTDMTLERNSLMERVYPRLKKFCREKHGLDFQVVDMRWGVRDEATDDHRTADLCSREIATCQRVSLGPNFVAFIGDKYGFRPLPNKIKSNEYCALRRSLIELDINTDFLDTWYREDLNAMPAEYVLQPISSILKNFTNKNEPELQSIDQRIWQAIHERLHDLLMIGSRRLVSQGRMNAEEQLMKYSISVTEREVIEGCLNVVDAKLRCLVYSRTIVDLERFAKSCLEQLNNSILGTSSAQQLNASSADSNASNSSEQRRDSMLRKASLKIGDDTISLTTSDTQSAAGRRLERSRRLIGRYIDLSSKNNLWQIDEEAQLALDHLKSSRLRSKLNPSGKNFNRFKIHWNEQDGMSSKLEEHKHYLNELSEHFYSNLVKMIRNAVRHEQSKVKTSGLVGEVLQHAHYARHVGQNVHGRTSELEQIRDYISAGGHETDDSGLPMFVYGIGGSGKTSLLARVVLLAREWILADQSGPPTQRRGASDEPKEVTNMLPGEGTRSNINNQSTDWNRQPCVIARFCCTTPASSTMIGVLTSVCLQLQYNFYQFGPLNGLFNGKVTSDEQQARLIDGQFPFQAVPDDFVRLVFVFRQLVENCRHRLHKDRLFLIVLDSIERLTSSSAESNVDEKYSWLTSLTKLPPNVRLVVSCSSEATNSVTGRDDDDYQHLKSHFLRLYHERARRFETEVTSKAEMRAAEDALVYQEDRQLSDQPVQAVDRKQTRSATHYDMLKRLLIPAVRLSRSKLLKRNSLQSIEITSRTQRRSQSVVAMPTSSHAADVRSMSPGVEDLKVASPTATAIASEDDDNLSVVSTRSRTKEHRWPAIGLLHVHPFGLRLAKSMLARWLHDMGRNLTQQQWSIVERSFSSCSRPIFVKLALGEVANWKSYSMQADSKGLTFGSSQLDDQLRIRLESARNLDLAELEKSGELDASLVLAKLICDQQDAVPDTSAANDELHFEWNLLSMEQQWLNFVDHCQQLELRSTESKHDVGGQQNVVIRIGAGTSGNQQRGASWDENGKYANLSSTSTTQSTAANTIVCRLSDSIADAICQLFARIELQHGYLLTKHSLSYITAARNGIGENELEDLLSLDDVVLDDVFQYHLPPIRRIPPLLWTRVRSDLPGYLNERDADGIVLNWHHNQFNLVARQRYLIERSQLVYIHSLMADYFLGKWADKAKPFECTKQQIQMAAEQLESAVQSSARDSQSRPTRTSLTGGTRRLGSGSTSVNLRSGVSFSVRSRLRSSDQKDQRFQWMQAKADRRVPHQPLFYLVRGGGDSNGNRKGANEHADKIAGQAQAAPGDKAQDESAIRADGPEKRRYNLRKLTELPYHLMHSNRFISLARNVFFNYNWLFASLDALGLQSLFTDFKEALVCLELALDEARGRQRREQQLGDEQEANPMTNLPRSASKQESGRDEEDQELDCTSIERLIEQLNMLSSTLRLSASTIHMDKQMLAPQLIARLLPVISSEGLASSEDGAPPKNGDTNSRVERFQFLDELIEQCDKFGCHDCALLPIDHCLQSADGIQLSSLEGHSFGIMSMEVTKDHRHLLATSNKFLMWDISTGEIAREIDPKLSGSLMKQMEMGKTSEFACSFTSDNLVLVLDILTQQVAKYEIELSAEESPLLGMHLIDAHEAKRFLVWTSSGWFVFRVDVGLKQQQQLQTADLSYGLSIRLEYSIDLIDELDLGGRRVLDVVVEPVLSKVDIAFVLLLDEQTGQLEFHTLELILDSEGNTYRSLLIWKQKVICSKLAYGSQPTKQLVYSDSSSDVYLTRRRKFKWSNKKLLFSNADLEGANVSRKTRQNLPLLALEVDLQHSLEGDRDPSRTSGRFGLLSEERALELADFERRIDSLKQEDEVTEQTRVLRVRASGVSEKRRGKSLTGGDSNENAVVFVRLYYQDRIVVLNLTRSKTESRKCLMLPRNIRNVAIESNRCRLSAILMQTSNRLRTSAGSNSVNEHYLVVAESNNLLVYSLEREQLLKCIEAHSGRVTQLKSIGSVQSASVSNEHSRWRARGTSNMTIHESHGCQLASCSMDRSVRIWNLSNLDRQSRPIERLSSSIGSICLHKQLPIVVCLSSDGYQLGIWNWQTLRLLSSLRLSNFVTSEQSAQDANGADDEREEEESGLRNLFIKCKFSPDGQRLAVATSKSVYLLTTMVIDELNSFKTRQHSNSEQTAVVFVRNFNRQNQTLRMDKFLMLANEDQSLVKDVKFLAQDSNVLVILQSSNVEQQGLSSHSSVDNETTVTASQRETSYATNQNDRLSIGCLLLRCYSIKNRGQLLYSIECVTPLIGRPSKKSTDLEKEKKKGRHLKRSGETGLLHLPVITKDQQSIVVIEFSRQQQQQQETRRSSSLISQSNQVCLNVYSARDGHLTRTVALDQIELADQLLQQARGASKRQSVVLRDDSSENSLTIKHAPSRDEADRNSVAARSAARLSVDFKQCSRMRPVRYFDRQSVVSLAEDESDSSYLIDTATGQLIAYSNQWNGRMSSDGRFGLTRILKSTGRANKKGLPGSLNLAQQLTGDKLAHRISSVEKFALNDGLQMLEMRRCRPVKSILSLARIAQTQLNNSAAEQQQTTTTINERELFCSFSKPNDLFVYYHELKSKRLLLVRLSDCRVIANYRLSTEATRVKCSPDGLALLLGLADGSLCSLAIADPQTADSLARLRDYPSRRRQSTQRS